MQGEDLVGVAWVVKEVVVLPVEDRGRLGWLSRDWVRFHCSVLVLVVWFLGVFRGVGYVVPGGSTKADERGL